MTINCRYLTNLLWNTNSQQTDLHVNEVHVWRACILNYHSGSFQLMRLLNDAEKDRMNRYHWQEDKHRFLIRRAMLRILLGEYLNRLPNEICISEGKNKKPIIENAGTNLHFNLSHSNAYILLAITNSPVGIDMEEVDPAFDYSDIVNQSFTSEEKKYLHQSDMAVNRFYELWTRKEALVKATAKGITDDLKVTSCLSGTNVLNKDVIDSVENWLIESFEVTDGYIGSLAHSKEAKLRFFDFDAFVHRLERQPETGQTAMDKR